MATFRWAACSDPPTTEAQARWAEVQAWLSSTGETGTPTTVDNALWADPDWWLVADPTGGSRARETLPTLVEGLPSVPDPRSQFRAWWSMSDNCLALNTLLDRGLCRLMHGHSLTLSGRDAANQCQRFALWSAAVKDGLPFPAETLPPLVPLVGKWPERLTLIGGNLGALERLGDTPWRPHPRGRVLLVESLSCPADQAAHRVAALMDDPWWEQIGGLALGRFTLADRDPGWIEGCLSLLPPDLPVCRIPLVGHGSDAWTIPLGEELALPR